MLFQGQRFGKNIRDLEVVGSMEGVTEDGLRALIASIGNLEALHLDQAITFLATYSGTITNMRHVWAKLAADDLDKFSQFTIKYAPYLRHLDLTLINTKDKTPEFIKLIGNLSGVCLILVTPVVFVFLLFPLFSSPNCHSRSPRACRSNHSCRKC